MSLKKTDIDESREYADAAQDESLESLAYCDLRTLAGAQGCRPVELRL